MIIVVAVRYSLEAILAQCMAAMALLWFGGWVNPMLVHFDDFASPNKTKIRCLLCGELYCISCMSM